MNFLDIKTDFAFKKVFGSEDSKDILLNFLNAVIYFEQERQITDLVIVDPYNIPMLKGMKDTFVDVKAQLDDGSKVIIEMQILNHEGFEKRVLYNAAKNYSAQLQKGDTYHLLNPVIALTLTDFVLFKEDAFITHYFKLLEKERFIEYNDDIELIFIELPKFNKTEQELQTVQDQWLYFIKNAGSLEYTPKNLEKELEKAFSIANEANLSAEELELQHKKREWIYIQNSALALATKQGLTQGIAQGIEQGIEQGKVNNQRETVINAHHADVPKATIALITGLSLAEVERILSNL